MPKSFQRNLEIMDKRMRLSAIAIAIGYALAGCSQSARIVEPKLVQITGNDEMKFDVTNFDVEPGQKVTVNLTNVGTLPRDGMAHNWALLEKGTDAARLVAPGADHLGSDFIPAAQATHVLAKTKMLGPGESDSITFTAPMDLGRYEYICSFPDHYIAGMKGIMTVKPSAK
jgi:azurin